MIKDEDYFDIPEDPELAFLEFEKEARATLERRIEASDDGSPFFEYYQEYINSTLAAAHGLGLDYFKYWEVPKLKGEIYDKYR